MRRIDRFCEAIAETCREREQSERLLPLLRTSTARNATRRPHDPVQGSSIRSCTARRRGQGAIVGVLRAAGHTVVATDLNDWGCPDRAHSGPTVLNRISWMPGTGERVRAKHDRHQVSRSRQRAAYSVGTRYSREATR
jgi:hypothetical protein